MGAIKDTIDSAKAKGFFCPPLTSVEKDFVATIDEGNEADSKIRDIKELTDSTTAPVDKRKDCTIRAEIVKLLCSSPTQVSNAFPHAIRIRGYLIEGRLDLTALDIPFHLIMRDCVFSHPIDMRGSIIQSLTLDGSRTEGLDADGLTVLGDLRMANGFWSTRPVCLTGARISGDLKCSKAQFHHYQCPPIPAPPHDCEDCRARMLYAYSLVLDRARVAGSVLICGGFNANGGVLLADAHIGGNLNCTKGNFSAKALSGNPPKEHGRRLACEADDTFHLSCALNADGIHVQGNVLLNEMHTTGETRLTGALIEGGLEAAGAEFRHKGSNAIYADRIRARGNVFLSDNFTVEGRVRMPRAEIGADLSFVHGKLDHSTPALKALECEGIKVEGTVYLRCFEAKGEVDISFAAVNGNVDCSDSVFGNKDATALKVDNAEIGGSLFLCSDSREGFKADGEVSLASVRIGKDLVCCNGRFRSNTPEAINASGVVAGGRADLRQIHVVSGLNLEDATINGSLDCGGATFFEREHEEHSCLFNAAKAKIGGSVYLNNGFIANGWVRLLDASIGMNLNCDKGTITNPNGFALHAQRIKVSGSVHLNKGFKAVGAVTLRSAEIGADIDCSRATFYNPMYLHQLESPRETEEGPSSNEFEGREHKEEKHYAVSLEGASICGMAMFMNGFTANGIVSLKSAKIGINLDCSGGEFINERKAEQAKEEKRGKEAPAGEEQQTPKKRLPEEFPLALDAEGVKIGGSANFRRFHGVGAVCLRGAEIGHYFSWTDVSAPDEITLLDLRSAQADVLHDDQKSWPKDKVIELRGFQYQYLEEVQGNRVDYQRIIAIEVRIDKWLGNMPSFDPQPYQQLAVVLRRSGNEEDAKLVLIQMNRMHLQHAADEYKEWAKKREPLMQHNVVDHLYRFDIWLSRSISSLWSHFLGIIVGYGYRPARALLWAFVIIGIGTGIFHRGFNKHYMLMTEQYSKLSIPPEEPSSKEKAVATSRPSDSGYVEKAPLQASKVALANPQPTPPATAGAETAGQPPYPTDRWADAIIYTLDTFLPVVNLKAEDYFVPPFSNSTVFGHVLYAFHRFLIIVGWVITAALIAAWSGVIRR